eukprot:CAMPEP_0196601466 /NCGR_PEP_ID=MMETSP1081-20130531/95919_1 /TAXON_ID=36882 /ORGANISM="Pyramimonas amylifera, Strain CCMP720" /LENGTH=408 /DNA_ID=CAMNT_0041927341 /DNA_START=730 /DNA_END=1956 /DNA_ORIENTATION=-
MLSIVCIFTLGGTLFNGDELTDKHKIYLSICMGLMMSVIAISAPMAAWIDVSHNRAGYKAKKLFMKLLLAKIPTLEEDAWCHSLRLKNAIDNHKIQLERKQLAEGEAPENKWKRVAKANSNSFSSVASLLIERNAEKVRLKKLELEEIHKTIRGQFFIKYMTKKVFTFREMDKLLTLDELIAPFVCNVSETSVYSRNGTAEYWRKLALDFPGLLDAVHQSNDEEVDEMRQTFEKLHDYGASYVDRSDPKYLHFIDLLEELDISSLCYWMCNTEPVHRDMMFEILESIAVANRMNPFISNIGGTKDKRPSGGRLIAQWQASARILPVNLEANNEKMPATIEKAKPSFLEMIFQPKNETGLAVSVNPTVFGDDQAASPSKFRAQSPMPAWGEIIEIEAVRSNQAASVPKL